MGDNNREPIILEGLLSPQQREILRRVSRLNKQIAHELKMSVQTVGNTLTLIYAKLGIRGRGGRRTRALRVALECGLLSLDEIIDGDVRVEDDNGIY